MGFWNKLPSDSEADRAEMLESYTSWVRGDKLSGKQKRFLRVFQEVSDCQSLKEMVDLAHQHFQEETKDVFFSPPPSVQQRVTEKILRTVRQSQVRPEPMPTVGLALQGAFSPDQIGSASELAYNDKELPPITEDSSLEEPTILEDYTSGLLNEVEANDWRLTLRVMVEEGNEQEYSIDIRRITLGSDRRNTIPLLKNAAVSPFHSKLTVEKNLVYLTDLNSQSGTLVDGVTISQPTQIDVGSVITIGIQTFEVIEIERDRGILMISFEETQGQEKGQVFTVQIRHLIVGRNEKWSHIHISDLHRTISRQHAQFELRGNRVYLTDLNSTNGTFIDEVRIGKPTPVSIGNSIRFGNVLCKIVEMEPI